MTKLTRLDYCQYLLTTLVNYTLTHFADHCERFSHDQINLYLAGDRLPSRLVWESIQPHLVQTPDGYIIFDDTVLDKKHAKKIALAQRQYSGNAHSTISGIGVVTCVYVNPELDRSGLFSFSAHFMANVNIYSKIRKYVHISMNNKPYTITAGEAGND